ncbi:MAG TPA: GAF domain-containing sensor histidine kinase [Coleofasciculaceae cyanobacterium]|jgi:signal transduction histidine kinase
MATETHLDHFLEHVLKAIADQVNAPLAEYWYYSEPNNVAYVGLTYWQGQILKPEEQPGHMGLSGYPVPPERVHQESHHQRRGHFIVKDMATSAAYLQIAQEYGLDAGAWYRSRGVNSFLHVPLILADKTIGALMVFLPGDRPFTEQHIKLTYAFAQQVTLAIQLIRLAEEAKQTAILSERNRMARELHDTLAQTFTGIVMQLEATQAMITPMTFEPAQKHLRRAGLLARQGLQEARRSVWSLRSEALKSGDLPTALLRIAQHMTDHTPIQTDVIVDGTPIALPAEREDHLLRIGQEALTNALKHAQPQKIQISLHFAADAVQLHIVDDGQGFDLQQQWRGFGIVCMQERTHQIGGEFSLRSQIGQGTTIHVTIPLPPSKAKGS